MEKTIEIVQGLGAHERDRIAALRSTGRFFWIDISLTETGLGDLAEAVDLPARALESLGPAATHPASRKFYADGQYVAFPFSCYVESAGSTQPVETHVLVSGDYVLTIHEERVSLPALLAPHLPEGSTRTYVVYAVLEAMVASSFDTLNDVETSLDSLAVMSADLRGGRLRIATLRMITARLARLRREVGPERTLFERVVVEVERLPGFEADHERYFDRLDNQLDRLVNAIEAAADTTSTLVDLRLNETSYWLTAVATIFLPLTFVTGFFGMNFNWMVDQVASGLAFLLLGVGGCIVSIVIVWRLLVRALPVEPDAPPRGWPTVPARRR